MSGNGVIVMGDRGRLVIPQDVRERRHLTPGTPLILLEEDDSLVLLTRQQLEARVRAELAGPSLVDELIAERRAEARKENE